MAKSNEYVHYRNAKTGVPLGRMEKEVFERLRAKNANLEYRTPVEQYKPGKDTPVLLVTKKFKGKKDVEPEGKKDAKPVETDEG